MTGIKTKTKKLSQKKYWSRKRSRRQNMNKVKMLAFMNKATKTGHKRKDKIKSLSSI